MAELLVYTRHRSHHHPTVKWIFFVPKVTGLTSVTKQVMVRQPTNRLSKANTHRHLTWVNRSEEKQNQKSENQSGHTQRSNQAECMRRIVGKQNTEENEYLVWDCVEMGGFIYTRKWRQLVIGVSDRVIIQDWRVDRQGVLRPGMDWLSGVPGKLGVII